MEQAVNSPIPMHANIIKKLNVFTQDRILVSLVDWPVPGSPGKPVEK